MKRYQQLSVWGSLGTLCLVLSPSCDDESSNNDGDGGDGGETTSTGGTTGGSGGGSAGESPTSGGSAGLGAGPSVPDCEDDEWLHPDDETCEPCVVHAYTCEDFVDETPGMGGTTSQGTTWDPDGNVLTLEQRSGLPPIVEASITFDYYDGTTSTEVSSDLDADGYLLSVAFPEQDNLVATFASVLTVTDTCGNESVIDGTAATTRVSWYEDGAPNYTFYCE